VSVTINFSTACRELLKHPDIYKHIDENFFLELDKNYQLTGQSSLERIKNLRNKLIHSEGTFETGTLDSEIIETVMVLHYLLLALDKNIICEVKHSNWLIQQILEYQHWEGISTKLKDLLIIDKDNYGDIPKLYSSYCPNCDSYESLRVQEKGERIDLICWICLQEAKLYECYICGTGVTENEAHILNQNDPDYIMCDCCWERKF